MDDETKARVIGAAFDLACACEALIGKPRHEDERKVKRRSLEVLALVNPDSGYGELFRRGEAGLG